MGGDHRAAGALTVLAVSRQRISLARPGRARLATEVDRQTLGARPGLRSCINQRRALARQALAKSGAPSHAW